MAKFEYRFELNLGEISIDGADQTEVELNAFGGDGWELVTVRPCGKELSYTAFYFKRQIS